MKKICLAMLGAAAMMWALNSCEKSKPEDPIQKRIEQLTALEKIQAKEVCAAFPPMFENDTYSNMFNVRNNKGAAKAANLLDSTKLHVIISNVLKEVGGDKPFAKVPELQANFENLDARANAYIVTAEELIALQKN
jgi:hypothetical protein